MWPKNADLGPCIWLKPRSFRGLLPRTPTRSLVSKPHPDWGLAASRSNVKSRRKLLHLTLCSQTAEFFVCPDKNWLQTPVVLAYHYWKHVTILNHLIFRVAQGRKMTSIGKDGSEKSGRGTGYTIHVAQQREPLLVRPPVGSKVKILGSRSIILTLLVVRVSFTILVVSFCLRLWIVGEGSLLNCSSWTYTEGWHCESSMTLL